MSISRVSPELRAIAGLILLLACCLPALAAPAIYDVEVIIFSNSTSGDHGERWGRPGGMTAAAGAFREGEFTELARSLYRLDGVSNALRQSRGYTVLFHRAWRQVATGEDYAAAYPVHTMVAGSGQGVEGSVRLVLERYLHLDADLQLVAGRTAGGSAYSDAPGSVPVYEMREQRRIRSGELHYFDHPHFGMIALVTPYAAPEEAEAEPETEPEAPQVPAAEDVQLPADDQLTR